MDELQRKISRKGYRSHLTRLMNKVDQIIESEERLSKKQIATLNSSIEQFKERGALLRDIDKEIVATIQEEGELEAEIIESEAIQEAISDKISLIKSVLGSVTTPTLIASAPTFVPNEQPLMIELQHIENTSVNYRSCIYQPPLGTHLTSKVFGTHLTWQFILT